MRNINSDPEIQTLLHNIAFLRRKSGLSKRRFAQLLHTTPQTLTRMEQGILPKGIDVEVFFYAWKHFGFPPSILLSVRLDEEKTPPSE